MLRCQFNCECPVNMHVASRVSEQLLSPANAMSLYYKHGLPAHFNILPAIICLHMVKGQGQERCKNAEITFWS